MTPAEARHLVENLLHAYTQAADARDVGAAVALLGGAEVRFPSGSFAGPEEAWPFLRRAWATEARQRHDVSNLVVHAEAHEWRARASYVRWRYEDEPVVHTLGRYDLVLEQRGDAVIVRRFTVSRQWSRD